MKQVIGWVIAAGFLTSCFATDARVLTMGRHDDFFMDDISIFRNPANINYYPNMLMGSYGTFLPDSTDTAQQQYSGLRRNNRDPQRPFAGAILSYSLNQSSEGGNQYPLFSFGVVFNRYDPLLDYLDPQSDLFVRELGKNAYVIKPPVGKIDLIFGYAFPNGGMIGVGGYFAFQKERENDQQFVSNLFKGNIGLNWPLAKSMNLEASMNVASLEEKGISKVRYGDSAIVLANKDYSWKADVRLFSALSSFNGDFVPHVGVEKINLLKGKYSAMNIAGGMGININIDKGFFWAALEGVYESRELKIEGDSLKSGLGARISMGIERNIIWDWWVWRVGVNKRIMYVTDDGENGKYEQNPEADASDFDFASFGWGLNIDNRLKVDIVIAEDVLYTFSNIISGPMHHITNRITVTYSF